MADILRQRERMWFLFAERIKAGEEQKVGVVFLLTSTDMGEWYRTCSILWYRTHPSLRYPTIFPVSVGYITSVSFGFIALSSLGCTPPVRVGRMPLTSAQSTALSHVIYTSRGSGGRSCRDYFARVGRIACTGQRPMTHCMPRTASDAKLASLMISCSICQ